MRLLRSRFLQAVLVLVLAFVILRFGIRPPAPRSVLSLYMFIISLAVLVFVSSDRDSWRDFIAPIWTTLVRPERRPLRLALLVVLPLLLGYYAYTQAAAKPQAPPELRAVHPAPPASIQFRGKEFNISGAENPLRKDAAKLKEHAAKGGCIACHKAGKIGASPVGPDLSQIAKIQTPDYIMKKILDPAGSGTVSGFPKGVMPPMFGQSLTAKEYMDLVSFLLTLK